MRKIFNLKIALIASIALLCLLAVFIQPVKAADAGVDDNYYFESVEVDITVRKDKTFEICEVLTTHFIYGNINTGIIRDIQRLSNTTRIAYGEEKKGATYIAGLSDVTVKLDGGEAKVTQSLYNEGNFYSVKMQKPQGYMAQDSVHVFELSYVYDMSDDKANGFDDFTFDLLGYAMARTNAFKATVTFPEGCDLSNVSFRTEHKAVWKPDKGESATVDNNVITVITGARKAGSGITVQTILPDDYFQTDGVTFFWQYIVVVVVAVGVIIAIIYLAFFTNKKPVCPVEFYPPDGMDVMRFSAVWNAGSKDRDTAALILKWAGMGLITIKQDGRHFVLRLKNVKSNETTPSRRIGKAGNDAFGNYAEREYFNTLFSGIGGGRYMFSTRDFAKTAHSNRKQLYDATQRLKAQGDDYPVKAVKEGFLKIAKTLLPFISLLPMIATVLYMSVIGQSFMSLFFIIFMLAGTVVARMYQEMPAMVILLVFPAAFVGFPYSLGIGLSSLLIYDYLKLAFITPVIYIAGAFVLPFLAKYRTNEVCEEYGKILGFRKFLLTAELPRIQLLFDENPDYFADILPYCLIMGISDKVRRRFAALEIAVPAYIDEGLDFHRMYSDMSHASRSGAPIGSGGGSGSGGGGGSGGSSGGGGGGGGSRGC